MFALVETTEPGPERFRKASSEQLDTAIFAASACVKKIKAGETLHMEGDPAPFFYQIVSGVIKEYNTLEDGRRQITEFYEVGDIFGLTDDQEHLYTAEAVTDSVVRYFPHDSLMRACNSPALSRRLLLLFISRLNRSCERMIMLGRMSASQRVALFLRRLAGEMEDRGEISLPMSRQDIADHLGLTTETVCRSLTELKRKGVIEMPSARRFSVRDPNRLQEVSRVACDSV